MYIILARIIPQTVLLLSVLNNYHIKLRTPKHPQNMHCGTVLQAQAPQNLVYRTIIDNFVALYIEHWCHTTEIILLRTINDTRQHITVILSHLTKSFTCDKITVTQGVYCYIIWLQCTSLNAQSLLLKNLLWKTADMVNKDHCGGVHIPCFWNTEALLYQHIIWRTALKVRLIITLRSERLLPGP